MNKYIINFITTALLAVFVIPCFAEQQKIYVSIAPQQWLVETIGGNFVKTEILLGNGQDPHTFEPTPRQIVGLSKADIYFTIGLPFENHITGKLAQTNSALEIVDSGKAINTFSETNADHTAGSHDHQHEGQYLDTHIWLSPPNLIEIGRMMTESMVNNDPSHKKDYEKNFYLLKQRLMELHTSTRAKLAPFEGARFLVYHPAFGYFANEYHLQQVSVEVEGKSPSPKQLGHIVSQARSDNIRVLFIQPQYDPSSAQVVARAINGTVVVLDPLAKDVMANIETMTKTIVSVLENRTPEESRKD